jgi:predicted RNase H-like nuclease (RuvC/YqgF family)
MEFEQNKGKTKTEEYQKQLIQLQQTIEKLSQENEYLKKQNNEYERNLIELREKNENDQQSNQRVIQKLQIDLTTQKQEFESKVQLLFFSFFILNIIS